MKRIIIIDDGNEEYSSESFVAHSNPCEYCNNNPKNNKFASGVCSCVLPYLNNVIY